MSEYMKRGIEEINLGVNVTENAGKSFEKIGTANRNVNGQIINMDSELQKVTENIRSIMTESLDIAAISTGVTESAGEVAAAMEEMTAGLKKYFQHQMD